jgi:magnesium-transporting ATPase (P-type)
MRFSLKTTMGKMFSLLFLAMSLLLIALAGYQVYTGLAEQKELVSIFVQSINTAIISLAIFELGIGIGKEYATSEDEENTFEVVRRTITRFVGTVCIALVLESLIMIIKYSQLELAGNLYYPVGILAGTSALLMALGIFLHFTRLDSPDLRSAVGDHGQRNPRIAAGRLRPPTAPAPILGKRYPS